MRFCDSRPLLLQNGEVKKIAVPYISPVDNRRHTYYPDFYVKVNNKKYIVEVKPLNKQRNLKYKKR